MDDITSFGYWLRRRRKALDLTQAALAKQVGCATDTIKKIEQDVRRPSRQLAELLADHLAVPDSERDRFVRMARGEYVSTMPSPWEVVSPAPSFLDSQGKPPDEKDEATFVAREQELEGLDGFLDLALSGQGQVVFVTGEAGRGKTALVSEFIQRAQEKQADLVVAGGNCNAYTGIGDPYLPFREVLALLTGDVETRWAAGAIPQEQAQRLWHLAPDAIQTLVNSGPDLIDTFIAGSALVNRAAAVAPDDGGWRAHLEAQVMRNTTSQHPANLRQTDLFEQYIKLLEKLAQHRPLLLILDDLQWADAGSINLMFHLGRRLASHQILMVGLYRPAEVALGRDGERHPLEPIVNEFQRQFGNIQVDLSQAEGKQFIDHFLDVEPNRLSPDFRLALFQHTQGQALFTIEMLRSMRERGDLIRDEAGMWVEGPAVNWDIFPARVEGAIGERINRLSATLQETLRVASVEGEFFTAEVVAQVRAIDNREVIQQLSSILDKQHRLVAAQGIQRVGPDGQRLSRYRFRHNLFQKYLYHSLDEVERAHQHEAVGNVLEALYQGHTDDIAIQLARHFLAAEQMSKAMHYLQPAGDAAARVYANAEAVAHYSRALALAKQIDADSENLTHLYTHLGRALELDSQFSRALANYQDMKELAHQRGDDVLELAALMALATLQTMKNPVRDEAQALALSEQSVTLARELGDRVAEAKTLWNLSNLYRDKNDLAQAIEYGERSLALTRQLNLREQQAFTLNDLALAYVRSNRLDQAKELLGEAIELWQELENQPMLANSLTTSSNLHTHTGQYDKAIALSNKAHQISQSIDNIWGQSYSLIMTGYIYWERGEPERAIAVMKKSIRLGKQSGFLSPQLYTRSQLAAVYGSLGAIKDGLKAAYLAKSVAEKEKPGFASFVPATLAQLHLTRDNLAEAEAVLDTARSGTESEGFNVYSVFVQADSELALKQGDYERAIAVTESLLADLRHSGAQAYIPSTLFLQARALLAQGQDETALERLLEAHTISKAIGSRRMLWQILFALSRLEPDPAEAERMRKLAQEIVEYIAGNVGDTELRASFLGLPEVKAVLG